MTTVGHLWLTLHTSSANHRGLPMHELPPAVRLEPGGTPGRCWHNARTLANRDPDRYLYAEGISLDGPTGTPALHGLCIERATGQPVELSPTAYRRATAYRAMIFEISHVEAFLDTNDRRVRHSGYHDQPHAPGVVGVIISELVDEDAPLTPHQLRARLHPLAPVSRHQLRSMTRQHTPA